jgi:hypothetical protein
MFLSTSGSVAAEEGWSSGRATSTRANRRRNRSTPANTVARSRGIDRLYRWPLLMTSRRPAPVFRNDA